MNPLESISIDEINVVPLNANHTSYPLHFYINEDSKSLFYGCDGAWLLYDTFYFLKNKQLDVAIFDCTVGDYNGDDRMSEHNSLPMLKLMLPSLKTVKAINNNTKVYISHLAPSHHKSHDETVHMLKKDKISVAFDGFEYNI